MDQLALFRGTRDEIVKALRERAQDAERLARWDKARAYRDALSAVQSGDGWVEVHRAAYYVVE